MKELQVQEKLFALNERYAEAHQIRNELKVIEISEQNRVENKIIEEKNKRVRKILKKHKIEIEQMQVKNQANKNKLLIRCEQEKIRLRKEIKLHNHDIKRNQNLASRLAIKIGSTRDELRRVKQNAKNLQQFLHETKRHSSARLTIDMASSASNLLVKKSTMKGTYSLTSTAIGNKVPMINTQSLTRFGIKSDATGTDRPVNVAPGYLNSTSFSAKTGKLLQQSRKEKNLLPSIAELYNQKLELVED